MIFPPQATQSPIQHQLALSDYRLAVLNIGYSCSAHQMLVFRCWYFLMGVASIGTADSSACHCCEPLTGILPNIKAPCKFMFPRESLDLQSWSWLVVCQGAWEHTFRNMFRSICQDVVFILVNNVPKQYTGLPP